MDTASIARQADILVTSAGVLNSLTADYVRPGQIVIDVSINWDPTKKDGKGGIAPCDTWDNATMLCTVRHDGYEFPMTLETKRIEPGATDQWYLKINGTKASVYFTSEDPDAFHYLYADGPIQSWSRVLVGSRTLFPTITGENFEFGFSDSILQMWAAYMSELDGKELPFGCVKPEHTHLSHALITAALQSHAEQRAVKVEY